MTEKPQNSVEFRLPNKQYLMFYFIAITLVISVLYSINLCAGVKPYSKWLSHYASAQNRMDYSYYSQSINKNVFNFVVMGSSRPAFGVEARNLAQFLGYKPDDTINIAFPGLGGNSMLAQIKDHESELGRARLYIMGIDDYFLLNIKSDADRTAGTDSFKQKTEKFIEHKASLLIRLNESGRNLYQNFRQHIGLDKINTLEIYKMSGGGAWTYDSLKDRVTTPEVNLVTFKKILTNYFHNKVFSQDLMLPYLGLIDSVHQQGGRIVLVDLPYHPYFTSLISDNQEYKELVRKNISAFYDVAKKYNVDFIVCSNEPTNCGVNERGFGDAVHLNAKGAADFTEFLGRKLTQLGYYNK